MSRFIPRRHVVSLATWLTVATVPVGCVLSIDPVIRDSDARVDDRVLGAWQETDGADRAVVTRGQADSYQITYLSDGAVNRFTGRLDSLGGRLVLEVQAVPREDSGAGIGTGLGIAGRLLLVLDFRADEVRISGLERDSVLAALRAATQLLDHRLLPDQVVLTGDTPRLRAVLDSLLRLPNLLTSPSVMRRVADSAALPAAPAEVVPCFEAAAWREADLLFRRDRHWVGGDAASSVALGRDRILWLFGDTWIDPSGQRTRTGARMISNSVGIQQGTDPATASMTFYWRRAPDGTPAPVVPDRGGERHWFGNGVMVGDRLVLVLNRLQAAANAIGFESVGWTAWLVENPDADPAQWQMTELDTPPNPLGVLVGFAAVREFGGHVYAFGSQDPVKSHPIHVVRWPNAQVGRGDLSDPEWWGGDRLGWIADSSSAPRQPLFEQGQSELSVHRDDRSGRFLAFHSEGFGPADVVIRSAPALTGPWSGAQFVFRPSEYYRPNGMVYAAKAHPQLTGADLVLTYATNTLAFAEHLTDSLIYYPRFVHLTRCR